MPDYGVQSFPISEQELISKAKQVFETSSGQKDPSVLSDDFRFEFPIVSLSKAVRLQLDFLLLWCAHFTAASAKCMQ